MPASFDTAYNSVCEDSPRSECRASRRAWISRQAFVVVREGPSPTLEKPPQLVSVPAVDYERWLWVEGRDKVFGFLLARQVALLVCTLNLVVDIGRETGDPVCLVGLDTVVAA